MVMATVVLRIILFRGKFWCSEWEGRVKSRSTVSFLYRNFAFYGPHVSGQKWIFYAQKQNYEAQLTQKLSPIQSKMAAMKSGLNSLAKGRVEGSNHMMEARRFFQGSQDKHPLPHLYCQGFTLVQPTAPIFSNTVRLEKGHSTNCMDLALKNL